MSNDAIQDLINACECPNLGPGSGGEAHVRAQAQHTANRDVIASLHSSLEGRAAEVELLTAKREYWKARAEYWQAKVARLESAIADHVIEEGAADIIAQIRKASGS